MARPSKFTPDVTQKIIQGVRAGASREVSARFAGVTVSTLYNWLKRGRQETKGEYHDFYEAMERGDAEAEMEAVVRIRQAAKGGELLSRETTSRTLRTGETVTNIKEKFTEPNWSAAAWFLERKHSDRWGRHDRVDIDRIVRDEAERLAPQLGLSVQEVIEATQELLSRIE